MNSVRTAFFLFALGADLCQAFTPNPPLQPPQLAPFGDGDWYVLTIDLPYKIGRTNEIVIVPRGFVTDLTSVPRFLWSIFPKDGKYMSAAILHDYLYWDQRCPRQEADQILKIEMETFGVDATATKLIFSAVDELGGKAWSDNWLQRDRGLSKLIPESNLRRFLSEPFDAGKTWHKLQRELEVSSLSVVFGTTKSGDLGNPNLAEVCKNAIAASKPQK